MDQKLEKWYKLCGQLGAEEREALESLISHSKRMRNALFECEDEIAVLLLLGMVVGLKLELDRLKGRLK